MINNYLSSNNNSNTDIYINLTEEEIKKLLIIFGSKIILYNKIVLIKINDRGYKIFKNKIDKRYYLTVITFKEPMNLIKPITFNVWNGNSILKSWAKSIDEIIKIINNSFLFSQVLASKKCFYMKTYYKDKNQIIISQNVNFFSYNEYIAFYNWYSKNFIRIITIQENEFLKSSNSIIKTVNGKRIKLIYTEIKNDNNTEIKNKFFSICFRN